MFSPASIITLPQALLLAAALLTAAAGPSALAQNGGAEKKPQQQVCIQLLGIGEPTKELGIESSEPGARRVAALADRSVIGPFLRDRSRELVFTQPEHDPAALASWRAKNPGQPTPPVGQLPMKWKTVAKAELPDSPNVLVILNFSGDRIVAVKSFDQSENALPVGRIALHSMITQSVAMELGQERFTLGGREQRLIPVTTPTGKPASVRVTYAMENSGQWQLVDRTSIVVNPNRRRHALLIPGGAAGIMLLLLPPAPADPVNTAI